MNLMSPEPIGNASYMSEGTIGSIDRMSGKLKEEKNLKRSKAYTLKLSCISAIRRERSTSLSYGARLDRPSWWVP